MTGIDESGQPIVETAGRLHPVRLQPGLYPINGVVTARYGDMDPNAHLNNIALEAMHEEAHATLTGQVFPGTHTPDGRRIRIVNSQNVVHFLGEAHRPCAIDFAIGVGRIGRTSFVLSSALFHDSVCISLCDSVMVAIEDGPVALGDDTRQELERLRLRTSRVDAIPI